MCSVEAKASRPRHHHPLYAERPPPKAALKPADPRFDLSDQDTIIMKDSCPNQASADGRKRSLLHQYPTNGLESDWCICLGTGGVTAANISLDGASDASVP